MSYTSNPRLLQTIAAVVKSQPNANAISFSPSLATYTRSDVSLATSAAMVMAVAASVAALLI